MTVHALADFIKKMRADIIVLVVLVIKGAVMVAVSVMVEVMKTREMVLMVVVAVGVTTEWEALEVVGVEASSHHCCPKREGSWSKGSTELGKKEDIDLE